MEQDSFMLKSIKEKYPDKDYPARLGQRWTDLEDQNLLNELDNNLDINVIANNHKRTIGGINARINEIAYKMYKSNVNIHEIIKITKLNNEEIDEIILRKKQKINNTDNSNSSNFLIELKHEIINLKNEIINMKNEVINIKMKLN